MTLISTFYNGITVGNTAFTLASLGLPNTAIWYKLYHKYVNQLSEVILAKSDEVLELSIKNEIIETMKTKYNKSTRFIHTFLSDLSVVNEKNRFRVGLDVAFDMGWQRSCQRNNYNSRSYYRTNIQTSGDWGHKANRLTGHGLCR